MPGPVTIIHHLERHLGEIARGWSDRHGESALQVACFENRPAASVATYATLGLSDHVLRMHAGREVRQEFLFAAYDRFSADEIASFLFAFAESLLPAHRALLRGDVLGPRGPLIPGATAQAVYAAIPGVFDDALATYEETMPPTVIAWLVPILPAEAAYVRDAGWEQFEDLLERSDVDLFDLQRASVV